MEAAQLQGFPRPFECPVPSPENRGVPGSSPGLAMFPETLMTSGFPAPRWLPAVRLIGALSGDDWETIPQVILDGYPWSEEA